MLAGLRTHGRLVIDESYVTASRGRSPVLDCRRPGRDGVNGDLVPIHRCGAVPEFHRIPFHCWSNPWPHAITTFPAPARTSL